MTIVHVTSYFPPKRAKPVMTVHQYAEKIELLLDHGFGAEYILRELRVRDADRNKFRDKMHRAGYGHLWARMFPVPNDAFTWTYKYYKKGHL